MKRHYNPCIKPYGLPVPSIPDVPNQYTDERRRAEILDEIVASKAGTLILLGDKPIYWFLRYFDRQWRRLSDFGRTADAYGQVQNVRLADREMQVIGLAHPRHPAKLGAYSPLWHDLHRRWIQSQAPQVRKLL